MSNTSHSENSIESSTPSKPAKSSKHNLIAMYLSLDITDPLPNGKSRRNGLTITDKEMPPESLAFCEEEIRQGRLILKSEFPEGGYDAHDAGKSFLRFPCPFNEQMKQILDRFDDRYVYWYLESDSEEGFISVSEIFSSNALARDESMEGWSDSISLERVTGFEAAVHNIFIRLYYSMGGYEPWNTDPKNPFAGVTDAIFRGKCETPAAERFHTLFPLKICRRYIIDTLYQGLEEMMETPELFREDGLEEFPRAFEL